MRLAHIADLHLGYRQYHRLTPTGINQREADVAFAFRRALDAVIAIRPDIVLVAGDVFHTVRPANPAIVDAFIQFKRLRESLPDAAIVMIAGNHDRPRSTETGSILKLFSRIGIEVVTDAPKRISFVDKNVSIFAVPNLPEAPPVFDPDPSFAYNVLMMHREVEGEFPAHVPRPDQGALEVTQKDLRAGEWTYIALGHYHVHHQIAPNAYYAGAIEYTSSNTWGELVEERQMNLPGKGFVEYDLETRALRFHHVPTRRALIDLPRVEARGMSAGELDEAIQASVDDCAGSIDDKIVRLVVRDVARHVARDLDHKMLREFKRRALHFNLDLRRPDVIRSSIGGAPGRRPTLNAIVQESLEKRQLESGVDRAALVSLGLKYLDDADALAAAQPLSQSPLA